MAERRVGNEADAQLAQQRQQFGLRGPWSTGSTRSGGQLGLRHPRDPVIEHYKKDVDRTLIRENLKLSVRGAPRQAPGEPRRLRHRKTQNAALVAACRHRTPQDAALVAACRHRTPQDAALAAACRHRTSQDAALAAACRHRTSQDAPFIAAAFRRLRRTVRDLEDRGKSAERRSRSVSERPRWVARARSPFPWPWEACAELAELANLGLGASTVLEGCRFAFERLGPALGLERHRPGAAARLPFPEAPDGFLGRELERAARREKTCVTSDFWELHRSGRGRGRRGRDSGRPTTRQPGRAPRTAPHWLSSAATTVDAPGSLRRAATRWERRHLVGSAAERPPPRPLGRRRGLAPHPGRPGQAGPKRVAPRGPAGNPPVASKKADFVGQIPPSPPFIKGGNLT